MMIIMHDALMSQALDGWMDGLACMQQAHHCSEHKVTQLTAGPIKYPSQYPAEEIVVLGSEWRF